MGRLQRRFKLNVIRLARKRLWTEGEKRISLVLRNVKKGT